VKSRCTRRFWKLHAALPAHVQSLAKKNYELWRADHHHPSLEFKKLKGGSDWFSVRVGDHYRAIGHLVKDGVEWVWIGTHEDYNALL